MSMWRRVLFVAILTVWSQVQRYDARHDLSWFVYLLVGVPLVFGLLYIMESPR